MKSIEYYLSKGFDRSMAEYFSNGRKKLVSVTPNDNFTLNLKFDNGETRIFDCNKFLKVGTVFEPFMKLSNFKRVYIDDTGCVAWDIDPNIDSDKVWSNKVDLSADSCYVDSVPVRSKEKVTQP